MQARILTIIFTSFIFILSSTAIQARTNLNLDLSISSAPPPPPANYVVAGPPEGYDTCYMTQGMWVNNVWVPQHQECTYSGASESLWVSGYWGCVAVGPGGSCGRWQWYSHRWARGHHVIYHYSENRGYNHRHRW